jgi:ABC-type uncharacterized transport system substrate-binding protein
MTVLAGVAAYPLLARAQQKAIPVIGYLNPTSPGPNAPNLAAFREGLSETGYGEGQNLAIEYRWAEGRPDRLPTLAADFVGRQVDLIAASGDSAALAAKSATSTIPIVFFSGGDAVAMGLVTSLARPGGNLTGVAFMATELLPKRLEAGLPTACEWAEMAQSGCLLGYGPSRSELRRRTAHLVAQIFRGALPGDLPIEQPTHYEFAVNLKTAKALGLTIPPTILARADEVIE